MVTWQHDGLWASLATPFVG